MHLKTLGETDSADINYTIGQKPVENKYTNFAMQLLAIKQQRDLNKLNLQRLSQGLEPVEAGALAPQVKVGADPTQLRNIGIFAAVSLAAMLFMLRYKR